MTITEEDLSGALTGRPGLLTFLQNKLDWPLDTEEDTFLYREADPEVGRTAVKAEVSRLVPVASPEAYPVFLVEFISGGGRATLRDVLAGIYQEICERTKRDDEEVVFVCADWSPEPEAKAVRFVRYEDHKGSPRIRSIGFKAGEIAETHMLRTVFLPALEVRWQGVNEPDWAGCRKTWSGAWDEEALARLFYRDYQRIFDEVRNYYVKNVHGDNSLFTQRLFHRLLLIHYLSKKGWLRFRERREYLFALRDAADEAGENFFRDRLFWVFFQGLGAIKVPEAYTLWELIEKRGEVPRLNISLFEIADRDDIHRAVFIENEAFDLILDRLLGRYQFTLFESTSEDREIAVDLEMLGRTLEKQVNGRLESGAYDTPRPFITYMCREAIKGFLTARTWQKKTTIAAFVDQRDSGALEDVDVIVNALESFTCVDPACGSGAYLLGMLQELLALQECLRDAIDGDPRTRYERKQEIILRNLAGVDKDPFAVNATHLRLWLSLLVEGEQEEVNGGLWPLGRAEDETGEASDTEAAEEPGEEAAEETAAFPHTASDIPIPAVYQCCLPNLDFRVVVGDSLACPDPSSVFAKRKNSEETIRRFEEKQALYASPRFNGDKKALRDEIRALRRDIAALTPGARSDFDWRVDFSGVFYPVEVPPDPDPDLLLPLRPRPLLLGGFDAVVTNPPNIRQEAIGREYKEKTLKRYYPGIYHRQADLSAYFYVRAVQLLKRAHGERDTPDGCAGGTLAFLSSNRWFRSAPGANLRQYIANHCAVDSITDFGALPVFESASAYPMIFIAQKGGPTTRAFYTDVKSLNPPYPDVRALMKAGGRVLPQNAISGSGWNLADARSVERIRTMRSRGIPLGEYVNARVYRGILTSLNSAYVIDGAKKAELLAADPGSADLIRPLTTGRDIQRWSITRGDQYLIVLRTGLELEQYPAIRKHLNGWEKRPVTWKDKGDEGWEPLSINHQPAFDGPKIYFQEVSAFPQFAFDCEGAYLNNEVFIIPSSDLYVLALLNSDPVWEFLQSTCPQLPNGALTLQTSAMLSIPIPRADEREKTALADIARTCLEKKGIGVEAETAELNRRVAALYGG